MYLSHFGLQRSPFSLSPDTDFYCELPTHHEALTFIYACLEQGEGFIKVIGEVGLGKTLLCRQLLNTLPESIVPAYIPNPQLDAITFRRAFARELGLEPATLADDETLQHALVTRLCELHSQGRRVLLVIDEAQAMPGDTLEAVRLLTNIETESAKLLQVLLFAQPELEARLQQPKLRQLQQRILFSYTLRPLTKDEMTAYLNHRLIKAGFCRGALFQQRALRALHQKSQGIPRVINILGHKALLAAYGQNAARINQKALQAAVADSQDVLHTVKQTSVSAFSRRSLFIIPLLSLAITTAFYLQHLHLHIMR